MTLIATRELTVPVVVVESEAALANGSNNVVASMAKTSNDIGILLCRFIFFTSYFVYRIQRFP